MTYLIIASKQRLYGNPNSFNHILTQKDGLIGVMTGQIDNVINDKSLFTYVLIDEEAEVENSIDHLKNKTNWNQCIAIFEVDTDTKTLENNIQEGKMKLFNHQVKSICYLDHVNRTRINIRLPNETVRTQYQEYFDNQWPDLSELNSHDKERRAYTPLRYNEQQQQLEPLPNQSQPKITNKKSQKGCLPWLKL